MTKTQEIIKAYEEVTDLFAEYFAIKYFGKDAVVEWVADCVGGVAIIADYFFDVPAMKDYMEHKYTRAQMFEYYEYSLNEYTEHRIPINIETWKYVKDN